MFLPHSAASKTLVIALGGNAISVPGEEGNIEQQFAHTAQTAQRLCDVIERGYQLVITHGNGPQVGNILRRVEIASEELYTIPLEVCVADTQAGMGYMIAQCLQNAHTKRATSSPSPLPRSEGTTSSPSPLLRGEGRGGGQSPESKGQTLEISTVVTTVTVDPLDPAFDNPTKPIGPYLTKSQADLHAKHDGWIVKRTASGHYRRIVPSPRPREILELAAIRELVAAGHVVICGGGGGIPVVRDATGAYHGAAAVVDKDRTTGLLASALDVKVLIILTAVDCAFVNFGRAGQQALSQLTVDEARSYVNDGQFGAGSMQPKIETAIDFVSSSRHQEAVAIVAHVDKLADALDGKSGTRIVAHTPCD